MKLRLIRLRDALADSFWFLPLVMALLAGGMALGSVAIDQRVGGGWIEDIGWVWSGGTDGARAVLSVVAGSVMTVVSIVFSLTVTTLAQTSSHYGPRVLRNFTSDRFVQFTLGTFVATFVYCLLVLRTVRSVGESSFVPYISVNLGVLLALASLAVLIFFIHHLAQIIQADTLIAEVGAELQKTLAVLFPQRIANPRGGSAGNSGPPDECRWRSARSVKAPDSGYLQRVDDDRLLRLATQHDLILKLDKQPGAFVTEASPLVQVLPPASVNDDVERRLRSCFGVGRHRTPHQDALYMVQQLVEIAALALSPGVNEPFTAVTCIDWLGASLRCMTQRELVSALRYDENGDLRVVAATLDLDAMAHAAFDQIRLYGSNNPDVVLRLLQVIADIAMAVHRDSDREVLRRHVQLIAADASQIHNEADRERVAVSLRETLRTLTESRDRE